MTRYYWVQEKGCIDCKRQVRIIRYVVKDLLNSSVKSIESKERYTEMARIGIIRVARNLSDFRVNALNARKSMQRRRDVLGR